MRHTRARLPHTALVKSVFNIEKSIVLSFVFCLLFSVFFFFFLPRSSPFVQLFKVFFSQEFFFLFFFADRGREVWVGGVGVEGVRVSGGGGLGLLLLGTDRI